MSPAPGSEPHMAIDRFPKGSLVELDPAFVRSEVRRFLAEDVGAGDVTTNAVVPPDAASAGWIVAREPCVVAGLALAAAVFVELDPRISVERHADDGDRGGGRRPDRQVGRTRAPDPHRRAARAEPPAAALRHRDAHAPLRGRGRRDGAPRCPTRARPRPGLRLFEKYAVRVGGGRNHRIGLYDGDPHQGQPPRGGAAASRPPWPRPVPRAPACRCRSRWTRSSSWTRRWPPAPTAVLLDNMTPVAGRGRRGPCQAPIRAAADVLDRGVRRHHARHRPRVRRGRRGHHLGRRPDALAPRPWTSRLDFRHAGRAERWTPPTSTCSSSAAAWPAARPRSRRREPAPGWRCSPRRERAEEGNTWYAQGGIIYRGEGDSPERLAADIVERRRRPVRTRRPSTLLAREGPRLVSELLIEQVGVPFDPSTAAAGWTSRPRRRTRCRASSTPRRHRAGDRDRDAGRGAGAEAGYRCCTRPDRHRPADAVAPLAQPARRVRPAHLRRGVRLRPGEPASRDDARAGDDPGDRRPRAGSSCTRRTRPAPAATAWRWPTVPARAA